MRQPYTFLLTVLLDEQDPANLRGRVRFVPTDEELIFIRLDALVQFVHAAVKAYEERGLAPPAPDGSGPSGQPGHRALPP